MLGDGGALVGPDHEFFRIAGVAWLRDGTLVVADGSSRELRFYGEDGRFLRSAGREGDGPGEFRYMADLWSMAGDTLVVWDQVALRLQHFSPDGAFVRSTSLAGATFAEFPSGGLAPRAQAVLENGRVVVFVDSPWTASHGVPERRPLLVALHRIDEGDWDSIRVVPGTERIITPVGDGQLSGVRHTFGA